MAKKIRTHRDLEVYKLAYAASMRIFWLTHEFPREEIYSLTSQIRRSSRSVSSGVCEAWRRRRYEPAFVSNLNESETEAAETQVWIQYAVDCKYMPRTVGVELFQEYDRILGMLVGMINRPEVWVIGQSATSK